jgi:hypothetical protein
MKIYETNKYTHNKMSDENKGGLNLNFLADILPWGIGGLFLGSAIGIAKKATTKKPINYASELSFNPSFFDIDPTCGHYFLKLQMWRDLSPKCFDNAGIEADAVLGKISGQQSDMEWLEEYERDANKSFHILSNNLESFSIDCRLWLYDNLVKQLRDDLSEEEKQVLLKRIENGKQSVKHILNLIKDIEERIKDHIFSLTS